MAIIGATTGASAADWAVARQRRLEAARRRSRFIKRFRWFCIAVAAGIGLMVIGFALANSLGGDFGFDDQLTAREALRMINPRFTGRSSDGYSYVVNAVTAVRRSRLSDFMDLDKPRFNGSEGQVVTAPKGVYDQKTEALDLNDGVVLTDKGGNRFVTPSARVIEHGDRVIGPSPIHGGGPMGTVQGDTYEIKTNSGSIFIRGHVRGVVKDSSP